MAPKRHAPRYCSECGIVLPSTSRAYAEICGGWAIEHEGGGAHNVQFAIYTGRILCAVHFEEQRPRPSRPILRKLCVRCDAAPVRFRQILHAWTQLPSAKALHDPQYSALALCRECWLTGMEGEQLALFDA